VSRSRWGLVILIPVFVGLSFVVAGSALRPEGVLGSPAAEFRVDADPSTPGIQTSVTHPVGASFKVRWNVSQGDTADYQGYQGKMGADRTIIEILGSAPLGVMCPAGQQCSPTGPSIQNAGGNQDPGLDQATIFAGEVILTVDGTTSFAGDVYEVELRCIAAGTSPLDLRPPPVDELGQNTELLPGEAHPTDTFDAQVTCGEGGAPPPTPGASPTPGGPAPTPGGPAPTATPLPPGLEAIGLAAGCNPVASTYPDDTPIQTIASSVGPTGILTSLWQFQAGTWLAYSPQFPEVSDLTEMDLLDVVFICVNSPGAFVRPIV